MIEAVVRNVILPLDWQAPADRLLLDHAVLLVMARLCRDLKAERASGLTPKQYRRIEEIMHAEPDGDHSLARLAGAVGLSPGISSGPTGRRRVSRPASDCVTSGSSGRRL